MASPATKLSASATAVKLSGSSSAPKKKGDAEKDEETVAKTQACRAKIAGCEAELDAFGKSLEIAWATTTTTELYARDAAERMAKCVAGCGVKTEATREKAHVAKEESSRLREKLVGVDLPAFIEEGVAARLRDEEGSFVTRLAKERGLTPGTRMTVLHYAGIPPKSGVPLEKIPKTWSASPLMQHIAMAKLVTAKNPLDFARQSIQAVGAHGYPQGMYMKDKALKMRETVERISSGSFEKLKAVSEIHADHIVIAVYEAVAEVLEAVKSTGLGLNAYDADCIAHTLEVRKKVEKALNEILDHPEYTYHCQTKTDEEKDAVKAYPWEGRTS